MRAKTCSKCKIEKPHIDFGLQKRYRDGRDYHCLECRRVMHATKYALKYKQETANRKQAKFILAKSLTHKVCIKCKINKEISCFYFRKETKLHRGVCGSCLYKTTNKDRHRQANEKYRRTEKGKKTISLATKERRSKGLTWDKKHPAKVLLSRKMYYAKNKGKCNDYSKRYGQLHRDKINKNGLRYAKKACCELKDSYVLSTLSQQFNMARNELKQIPFLVNAKRELLRIKRSIKQ